MYENKGPCYGEDLRKISRKLGYINFIEGVVDLYLIQKKSQSEIAKVFERSQRWVCDILHFSNIECRPRGGANFKGKKK